MPAKPAADPGAEGTGKIVQGIHGTTQGIGQIPTKVATTVERRFKAAGAESRPTGEKRRTAPDASPNPSGMA
jgi:hypothetical protein